MPKKNTSIDTPQTPLPLLAENEEQLDLSKLETWLWDAACVIRGATDAPKFKDFILPLIFYKRLSEESREKLSSVITLEDAQKTDYNLSPSQFVDVGDKIEHRPMNEILVDLTEARIAREKADNALEDVLMQLGLNEKH